MRVCVHRGECMRVYVSACVCSVFKKKQKCFFLTGRHLSSGDRYFCDFLGLGGSFRGKLTLLIKGQRYRLPADLQ